MTVFPSNVASLWQASAAVALAAALAGCNGGSGGAPTQDANLFTVHRGDLPITVRENAELQALRETIVRSEVEGQSTIIYIVPEGTVVKEGERLVELDVSELMEKEDNQEISVGKAKNALDQAVIQQGILEKELTTKRNTASSGLRIAALELEKLLGAASARGSEGRNGDMVRRLRELVAEPKAATPPDATAPNGGPAPDAMIGQVDPRNYAGLADRVVKLLDIGDGSDPLGRDMGEMANRILQATDQIRLAMADLKVKEDTVTHSRRLASKKFITRNELERDELAYQSQASKVTIAWNDLELLINYTLDTERIKLKQDYENARLELERVDASNEAERQKSLTDVDAKRKEYEVAKERLENLQLQIKNGVILAPTPGTVVYARIDRNRGGGDAVREGVQVRERQELIILPDTTKMRCLMKVQEAEIDKVMRGQPAYVTVEAFQGETFTGRVTSVAPVADSNSGWQNADRKVYTTLVELDSDNPDGRLRSRMAANVTIMVDTVKQTLPVPLQAVFRDRSTNFVWKRTADGPVATPVKVGRQNKERVAIVSGLDEGDVLYLVPPSGVQAPKLEQPVAPEPAPLPDPAPAVNTNGSGANGGPAGGDGAGGDGQRRPNRPNLALMRKPFAEMTPEEVEEYKGGSLDRTQRMIDMARLGGNEADAKAAEEVLAKLRDALDQNDFAAAQTHRDALGALSRRMMNRGSGGGDGAERPRRGGGERSGDRGGNGEGGGRRGN